VRGRSFAAVLAALAAGALVLSGCDHPPDVDGDLTNNWSAMPEAKVPSPPDRACYQVAANVLPSVAALPTPVGCTVPHNLETIHVGTFAGPDAGRDSPPPAGDPSLRRAYEVCAGSAGAFLGDDWRTGRIGLTVVVPVLAEWDAGARWYRCDLVESGDAGVVSRTASLQGTLAGSRPAALTCFAVAQQDNVVDSMRQVDCGIPHDAEFAGVYDPPDGGYPDDANQRRSMRNAGCRGVVASFVGVPNDGNVQSRTGWIFAEVGRGSWEQGNRGIRCYIAPAKPVAGSLRAAGPGRLPIR